jgi:hypothetical protein
LLIVERVPERRIKRRLGADDLDRRLARARRDSRAARVRRLICRWNRATSSW